MDFTARSQTIREVLSTKKEIIVPRFQREFVWEKDDALSTFWEDIVSYIEEKDGKLCSSEYFLGNVVLIDDTQNQSEKERYVVDGQQRLTAITILLSALYDAFKKVKEDSLAQKIYEYIVTSDDDGKKITLLRTESPKPFFQMRIQSQEKDTSYTPKSTEEKRLLDAYEYFVKNLSQKSLEKEFKDKFDQKFDYLDILKAIRDHLLGCMVVYVAVKSINDAYMIFEVLNAKGQPLNAVELIKNILFKELKDVARIDNASEKWKKIKENVGTDEDVETFYRHFWLARYHFTNKKKLYQDFLEKIAEKDYNLFLDNLVEASDIYKRIITPKLDDWKRMELLPIFYALSAFATFHVTQVRTLVLSLIGLYQKKKITIKILTKTLLFLENFHFVFSAICSSRPSGLESKYSKYSLKLQQSTKNDIPRILKDFVKEMKEKIPPYETFRENIHKLWYTDDKTDDKSLIQYIFSKLERSKIRTKELDVLILSLEHIHPQSLSCEYEGLLGNLLPLDVQLNSDLGSKSFSVKIKAYAKSSFITVKEFCQKYKSHTNWQNEDIIERTDNIANELYYEICKFK